MKIGIEAQRIFRAKKHGMDIVALELIKNLQRIDTRNEYVVFVKPGPDRQCLPSADNFKVVEVPALSYPDWEQLALPKAAAKEGIELLHCTSNTAPLNINIPTVVTLHDIIYLEKLSFGGTAYQALGNLYRRLIVPKAIKQCSGVITVSEFEKKNIVERLGLSEDKVKVAYNGVSEQFSLHHTDMSWKKLMVKEQFQLPERYIFFLGNPAPKKNMKGTLKAYARYRELCPDGLPLVMAECNEERLQDMLKSMGKTSLRKHIHLTGYIAHELLPVFYKNAALFLYPSFRESFGIPIIEAMAAGTPVISSRTSSMPEVGGGAARYVNPKNIEALALNMADVLAHPAAQVEMIAKGISRAKEFTWKNTAQNTLSLYEACYQEAQEKATAGAFLAYS